MSIANESASSSLKDRLKRLRSSSIPRSMALLSALAVVLGVFANCSFRTPAEETPVPTEEAIEKSFFVDPSGKPKTFLCGWAPETEMGELAEAMITHNIPVASHCNVQFEITEEKLLGKMINPSHPNDPKRWETIVSIPIVQHYYREKAKDGYGRDTNEQIDNSRRSHWSARPLMKLDLSGISIQKWAYAMMLSGRTGAVQSVEDIEWDKENNFLGFSVVTSDPELGAEAQARFRINFLKFDHNPNFKKTPFSDKNYTYLNALHITGEKIDGVYPVLYAAHWDLSKQRKVTLNGFPQKYIPLGEATVEAWNKALQEVGAVRAGQKPFVVDKTERKHSFDLRYTSITWVDDLKISSNSPLGVGNAHADVRNGEILWGGITVYGGIIESYIKSYMGSALGASGASSKAGPTNFSAFLFDSKLMPKSLDAIPGLRQFPSLVQSQLSQAAVSKITQELTAISNETQRESGRAEIHASARTEAQKAEALNALEETLRNRTLDPSLVRQMLANAGAAAQFQLEKTDQSFSGQNFRGLLSSQIFANLAKQQEANAQNSASAESTAKKKSENEAINRLYNLQHGNMFDLDRRLVDVSEGWHQRLAKNPGDYQTIVQSVVKELLMHEYGHMLGLGHQFKENLLPEEGTVPAKIYSELKDRATEEAGFTNYTSIMGYRHPETEISDKPEHIGPGEQDKLVLSFLYNQKYATFKKGDDKFTFFDLPKDGIIPPANPEKPEYKTAYFKQCNDLEASLSFDPYCNRFDRGHNATEIAKNYIKDFKDNLVQTLFAFTDSRGGNPWSAEGYLWARSLNTMGRLRLFYDYMRRDYAEPIAKIASSEKALYEFSSACAVANTDEIKNDILREEFTKNPELKELCAVNKTVIDEIISLVSLNTSDYTKIDFKNAYVPGGMSAGDASRDYSRMLGTWNELSGLPLKISALYALTSPNPWVTFGGMMANIPNYDYRGLRFAYSSLYPREHTQAVSAALRHNLRFASLGQADNTTIGDSILALSYFNNYLMRANNEANRFPPKYIEMIRNQTKFNFNYVAVLLEVKERDNASNRYYGFDPKIYDMQTGKQSAGTWAYILPGGKVIARAENMFLLPVTDLQFLDDKTAYVFAYKLDYVPQYGDILADDSVKSHLRELYDSVLSSCVTGTVSVNDTSADTVSNGKQKLNGLSQFFNRTEFPGFYMPPGLATSAGSGNDEKLKLFYKSIDESFDNYYKSDKFAVKPKPETCRETIRGLQVIVSAAAILNGYWVPEATDYIQK